MEALEKRNKHDTFFASFIKTHRLMPGHTNEPTKDVSCYKSLISAFKQYCMSNNFMLTSLDVYSVFIFLR